MNITCMIFGHDEKKVDTEIVSDRENNFRNPLMIHKYKCVRCKKEREETEDLRESRYYKSFYPIYSKGHKTVIDTQFNIRCPICKKDDSMWIKDEFGYIYIVCNSCGSLIIPGFKDEKLEEVK